MSLSVCASETVHGSGKFIYFAAWGGLRSVDWVSWSKCMQQKKKREKRKEKKNRRECLELYYTTSLFSNDCRWAFCPYRSPQISQMKFYVNGLITCSLENPRRWNGFAWMMGDTSLKLKKVQQTQVLKSSSRFGRRVWFCLLSHAWRAQRRDVTCTFVV